MARCLIGSIVLSLLCGSVVAVQAAETAPAQAIAQPQSALERSAQAFVQGFYSWYVEKVDKANHWLVYDALENKRWPMSDTIVAALKADGEAQDKSPDEIVGIDFDPFLDAQDTCFPYKAGKVTRAGNKYQVEVFDSNCSGPHPELPQVVAELEQHDGSWVFVNFIYPKVNDDLLSTLKGLKEEREKEAKQPKPSQDGGGARQGASSS